MKLFDSVREIPITDLEGLRIGNAQDYEAMTGVMFCSSTTVQKPVLISAEVGLLPGKLHSHPPSPPTIRSMPLYSPAALPSAWLPVTESCAIWKNTVLVMKPDLRRFR